MRHAAIAILLFGASSMAHAEPIYRRHTLPDGRHALRVAEGREGRDAS